ncbi:hypothetical protein LWC08_15245 (plasmid) [Desulfobaculum bizertense]|uniref:hypothetical protein n=1 Tax=Desulfobaculum bizertense TaxID=376490 RepID=UPI001F27755F|nr:hypothetical protein [Desulfobaculum bizertense]UIJ39554.1 hypothetical protein LWC08_15245 [Desulfobaculum bizertense]
MVIKRRTTHKTPTAEEIERFAAGADTLTNTPAKATPTTPRTAKAKQPVADKEPKLTPTDKEQAAQQRGAHLPTLQPHAKRDFKAIRVPFNEFEFTQLEQIATKTGRSKLNCIRWALSKLAEQLKEDDA